MTKEEKKSYMVKYRIDNKERISLKQKEYRENNKLKRNAQSREWRAKNSSLVKEFNKEYKDSNKDILKVKRQEYRKDNHYKFTALQAKRESAKKQRTPEWANMRKIKSWYKAASIKGLHVDHVIPLQGKLVSGLHVHNNLQLLSISENSSKKNKFVV